MWAKYIWLLASVLLGTAGQVLMKWGVGLPRPDGVGLLSWKSIMTAWPIAAGIGCYGFSSICWLFALKQFPLSTAYPMVSLGYIFVMLLGYALFQESLSVQKWCGAAFISAGVLLIARA